MQTRPQCQQGPRHPGQTLQKPCQLPRRQSWMLLQPGPMFGAVPPDISALDGELSQHLAQLMAELSHGKGR